MDKPEDIAQWAWDDAKKAIGATDVYIGRLSALIIQERVARAILSAQSQAYIDAARIAEECYTQSSVIKKQNGEPYNSGNIAISCAQRISAAILQRKEEIGLK